MLNPNWSEEPLIAVPRLALLKLINALTLAHLELSASRHEVRTLTEQTQNLQRQLKEAQTAKTA